ncbi:anti sigma factor C-terminal domain-containing protein [Paenibacillus sp. FSL E2-0177]|uniref:anti sigma factor C-terminal domain-containing protein n=1 Tax=Paenibacillus sp. FSL E2-0177 TaxID=2921360 RepID=UPI0030EEB853
MTAPWEQKDDQNLSKVIKKAKRKTMIRNTIISLVVTVLVLFGGMLGNAHLTSWLAMRGLDEERIMMKISSPNLQELRTELDLGFLSGKVELSTYKVVEGVPIVWDTKKLYFDMGSRFSLLNRGYSSINVPDPVMTQQNYEYYRGYNSQNGQREMMFYVPGVNYNEKVLNDLPSLEQMEPGKFVEMAVSFDKSYTQVEVEKMLPAGLTQTWYWVDTYDNKKNLEFIRNDSNPNKYALPESARQVYGYGGEWEGLFKPKPEDFLQSLTYGLQMKGKHYGEFERISNYLKKDKAAPDASDVQLLGVVVTGTAKELQSLKGKPYVNTAVLGAIVDKY